MAGVVPAPPAPPGPPTPRAWLTSPGPASSPLMLFAPSVQLDHEPSVCVLASRLIVLVHLKLPRIWARWAGVSMGRSGAGRGFDCVGDGGDGPTQQGVHHRGRRVLAGGTMCR